MDPHKIIQELIDQPQQDKESNDGRIEKAIAQRKIDIEVWLKNSITNEKIRRLNVAIENNENQLRTRCFDEQVSDKEIRIIALRLTALKDVRDTLISFE